MSASSFDPTVECSTLVELLCWRALHQTDRRAYTFLADGETEEVSLTYEELDRQARAIGALLQSLGATGERVLLLYPPGLEYIAAFFGCLYAGGIAVPSYPPRLNRPDPRLQAIVADAQATVALTTPHILSNVERRFAHTPRLEALRWLCTDKVASDLADAWRDPAVEGDTLAFLQYTSGSTATPKGVIVSHGNILHNERMIQQAFGQTERSTVVGWLPIYHDMGLIGNVLQPLYVGAHCILMSPLDFLQKPFYWLQAISHYKAHTSGGPNFAYDLCVDKITPEQRATLDLSSWEVAFSGAEPVRHQTLERFAATFEPCGFRREAFYPCYGLAEATLFVSGGLKLAPPVLCSVQESVLGQDRVVATAVEDEDSRTLVGCGRTWADQEIIIVNPETLTQCPPDRVGEIWVSGANVAQGYWNQAEETEHTFQAYLADTGEGPFLRTGDLGFLREGELFITGRIKDLIIIRGRNYYPQDIELSVEESHSALQPGCGAAFSVEVDDEERLVVVQELRRAHRKADVDKVAETIRQAVAEEHELQVYAVALVKPMSIPKTSSGKIQRRACRAKFLDGSLEVIGVSILDDVTSSPSTDTLSRDTLLAEALLALEPQQRHLLLARHLQQQVAHLLRVAPSRVDPQQPLSALGLDSLMAVELQHSLETGLGVVLPMASFLESPSIARLAVHIADQLTTSESLQTPSIPHVSRDGGLPLSFAQQRLWLLDQLEPGNPAYNLPAAVRLCGSLDVAALAKSVNEIIRRHESLRTTFAEINGRPIQVIAPATSITVPVVDLRGFPRTERETETQRLITEEAQRPFDLTRGPLLRVTLLWLDEGEHVFVLVMHHIVSDGWSMGVFGRELAVLYEAFSAGKPSPLPELPIQYVDFAHWQQHWLDSVLETQISYWKQQLSADLPALDLPTERPRPAIRTFRGARQSLMLPKALTKALKALSQQEGCTLFMTLLAAFKIILHRYSGQDDVIVGSPVAGRNRAEARDLIGFFLNTLVLRTNLSGNPTFRELLGRVREAALEAFANQDLPFERLLEELQPHRDLSRTPLFQVFFNMLNLPGKKLELPGLTAEILLPIEVMSLFDLTLYTEEQNERIKLDLVYNTDLFGQAQMAEMLEQLDHLLLQIVEKPGESIVRYSLVTAAAAEVLPNPAEPLNSDWEGAVHTLFSQQARRVPEHLAVVDKQGAWTYKELDARSNQLANYLRAHGIQHQDIVAIYAHRSASLVWAVLGILKAGAAFTILDPAYPPARLIACLQVAQPRGWLQVEVAGKLPAALEEFVTALSCRCRLGLPHRSAAAARGLLEGYSTDDPGVVVGPDDLALVAFTSGSTGVPKGILGRHGPLSHFLPWQKETFDLRSSDRYSMLSGLSHDPLQRDIFTSLCLGATLCIPDPKDIDTPGRLAEWMRQETISIAHLTPAMLQLLTQTVTGDTGPIQEIPSLRYAFTVGDVLTKQDISRFQKLASGVRCVCFYGSTETQRAVGYFVPGNENMVSRETIPLGKGIQDVQLLVLNASQELAGIGEMGEIYVRGPHLAKGYLGDEASTRERFLINPFTKANGDRLYRTGDLGRYLPDGNVEFLGRTDYQVKIRGFRIELGEIEAALGQHPAVRETVILAREDVPGDPSVALGVGKRLVAYIVPHPAQTPTVGQLRRFLKEKLPDYMVPSAFVFLESLPLTPNGKVDRRALPAPDMTRPDLEEAFVAPRTPEERLLATIWAEILRLEQVGVHDNFFDLGGNSAQVVQVHSKLREVLDKDLPILKMFEYPTIHLLAEYVTQEQDYYPALQKSGDRAATRKALRQRRKQPRPQKR